MLFKFCIFFVIDVETALNNDNEDIESEDGVDEDEENEDREDEDAESEVGEDEDEATGPGMKAKDGTQWAATPPSEHQAGRRNIVRERCGPSRNTSMLSNLDTFKLFLTPEMAEIIIRHTNKKASSTYAEYNEKNPEKKIGVEKSRVAGILCTLGYFDNLWR